MSQFVSFTRLRDGLRAAASYGPHSARGAAAHFARACAEMRARTEQLGDMAAAADARALRAEQVLNGVADEINRVMEYRPVLTQAHNIVDAQQQILAAQHKQINRLTGIIKQRDLELSSLRERNE